MVLHKDLYFLSKKYRSIFFSDLIFLSVFLFPLFTVKESPATFDRLLKKQPEKKCEWKTKVPITLSMCMIKWRNIYHKYIFISWISLGNDDKLGRMQSFVKKVLETQSQLKV